MERNMFKFVTIHVTLICLLIHICIAKKASDVISSPDAFVKVDTFGFTRHGTYEVASSHRVWLLFCPEDAWLHVRNSYPTDRSKCSFGSTIEDLCNFTPVELMPNRKTSGLITKFGSYSMLLFTCDESSLDTSVEYELKNGKSHLDSHLLPLLPVFALFTALWILVLFCLVAFVGWFWRRHRYVTAWTFCCIAFPFFKTINSSVELIYWMHISDTGLYSVSAQSTARVVITLLSDFMVFVCFCLGAKSLGIARRALSAGEWRALLMLSAVAAACTNDWMRDLFTSISVLAPRFGEFLALFVLFRYVLYVSNRSVRALWRHREWLDVPMSDYTSYIVLRLNVMRCIRLFFCVNLIYRCILSVMGVLSPEALTGWIPMMVTEVIDFVCIVIPLCKSRLRSAEGLSVGRSVADDENNMQRRASLGRIRRRLTNRGGLPQPLLLTYPRSSRKEIALSIGFPLDENDEKQRISGLDNDGNDAVDNVFV